MSAGRKTKAERPFWYTADRQWNELLTTINSLQSHPCWITIRDNVYWLTDGEQVNEPLCVETERVARELAFWLAYR